MSDTNAKIVLVPGLLIAISTRVEGGVKYKRVDLPTDEAPDAVIDGDTGEVIESTGEVTRWETTRVLTDAEEFKAAGKVRSQARKLIESACLPSRLGFLICPVENEPLLDQRITEAQVMVSLFNDGAVHSRVRVTPIRAIIASSKGEAEAAVGLEVSGLIESLQAAIAMGEVGSIRDLASKVAKMGNLLESQTAARGALNQAVAASRKIARDLKRAAAAGERVAEVIEAANTSSIASARFIFAGGSLEDRAIQDDLDDDDTGQATLPGVAAGRFSGLGGEREEEEEEGSGLPGKPTFLLQAEPVVEFEVGVQGLEYPGAPIADAPDWTSLIDTGTPEELAALPSVPGPAVALLEEDEEF